jgi:nucleoside-diphosphate-sugar epimerase
MKILITGSSGFVGQIVTNRLASEYPIFSSIHAVCRQPNQPASLSLHPKVSYVIAPSLEELNRNTKLLASTDCIIHLAARVHQMNDKAADPLAEFRAVNTTVTLHLAQAAAAAGVCRFIYLSSIKVHGEETAGIAPYTESDILTPQDPYGISKWEAETQLKQLASQTGLEVVILRPPLVYGPKVKANFLQMLRIVQKGIPLPLGAIRNRRSLIYVENLADAIINAALHPAAANQTFLVSDGEDLSTPQLIRHVAQSLQCPPRLLPIPVPCLKLIGKLAGKSAAVSRLTGSLVIDSTKIRQTLNWQPPYTLDQGLQATADWFKSTNT